MTTQSTTEPVKSRTNGLLAYLLITAVLCGGLIMVIEVLGSRVIGPFFGVSLFVWTSLIAVTLVALALGYACGGLLADRRGTPEMLYTIIGIAGMLVLLIPWLKEPVLIISVPFGLRGGSFLSATLLFGPSLFLLGCVSPYLVKVATEEMRNLGRTVGGFYALSTLGSVAGTILTGFFLIAYLGIDQIFLLIGILLILLALGYFLIFRRRWQAAAAMVLPFLVPMPQSEGAMVRVMPDGTRAELTAAQESFYGSLKVVDYRFDDIHTRELIIDGLVQGGIDVRDGRSIYPYSYFLQFLPRALQPQGERCLVIGLGAGIMPVWYESQGVQTDVVDIDPEVVKMARSHFNFDISGTVHIEDARYFLNQTEQRYDYILLDVFNGDTTPGHLLSVEALQLLRQRLEPGGVVGINLVGSLKRETYMTASMVHTLKGVFDQVEVYPVFDPNLGSGNGNLAVIAYDGPQRQPDFSLFSESSIHPFARDVIRNNIRRKFTFPANAEAIELTDDYNPIDFFDAWLKEQVRLEILKSTHWDILLSS